MDVFPCPPPLDFDLGTGDRIKDRFESSGVSGPGKPRSPPSFLMLSGMRNFISVSGNEELKIAMGSLFHCVETGKKL